MSHDAYAALEAFFGLDLNAPAIAPEAPTLAIEAVSDIDPDYAFFAVCRPREAAIDGIRKIGEPVRRLSYETSFNRDRMAMRLDIMEAKRIENSRHR